MRASAITTATVAVALAMVMLSGCATPDPGLSPEPSPTVSPSAVSLEVDVFFAHAQPTEVTLIGETRTIELPAGAPVLDTVLGLLVSGELQPLDPDYANLWADASVVSTSRAGDVLTVDLTGVALNVGAEAEGIALAQLVWTTMAVEPAIAAVQVTLDGAIAETLAGHVDITGPLGPPAPESVLTPVQITAPLEGATVMSPVVAVGVACVFEAAVQWRLDGPDGSVQEGSTMAAEACPARAPWQLELGELAPGDYLLTVIERSAMDGSIASTDSKAFTVSG